MNKNKFRIWDKKYKQWADPHRWRLNAQGEVVWNRLLSSPNGQEDFVIQQFTGLVDKNSKEIWEGDIIETIYNTVGIIYYEQTMSSFRILHNGNSIPLVVGRFTENNNSPTISLTAQMIIGNVFENPELLTK